MTFEVGRLSAALTMNGVEEGIRDIRRVGDALEQAGSRGSSFGRIGVEAVRRVAGVTTNLTAAAGAYLTILTKQGVAYNSLQQNSRAALTVLLGGAEKANAQMAKLDDFARTSPFSKGVFIQAQQQLLGFGMEASKVVPTLDAVQQSVAAMGGSNEQISEIVNILANVNSTGKITAETFNQLGYRGIDGAELLGKAWGKTAAEIRDEVSRGAIDGKEAIAALVDSMQDRFGGAADGVKEQWSGAVDRIKAAQRDLGAHIAEPFVSAKGGGMAVTWGNQVADVLRAIEKQAIPVMGILTQRSMPFFASLTEGLDSAAAAVKRWNPQSLEQSLDRMAKHAPGIAALAGAFLALGANVGPLGKLLSTLGMSGLNPVLAAFIALAAASPELRAALSDLVDAGKPLLPVVGELATILSGSLNSALPLVSGGIELLTAVLRPVVGLIDAIPTPVLNGALAFAAMHKASEGLAGPLGKALDVLKGFGERAAVQAALGETTIEMGALSTASKTAKDAVKGAGNALKTAFLSNPIGVALTVVSALVGIWAVANAKAQQKVEEHNARVAELKGTLDETSGALTDASREMIAQSVAGEEMASKLEAAGVSNQAFVSALMDGSAAADAFRNDLVASAAATAEQAGRSEKAREAARMLGVSYETLVAHSLGFSDATDEVNAALDETGGNWASMSMRVTGATDDLKRGIGTHLEVAAAMQEQRAALEDAQAEAARYRDGLRDATAAMSDAARSNQRFNDALAIVRDVTLDAETRLRALRQALDELKGAAISAEEAQKRLAETNLNLAEGLAVTDENGTKLWASMLDGAGKIELSTREGLAFSDAMGRSRDAMLDAAMAASDQALANGDLVGAVRNARNAGEEYIATLRRTMEDAGLTSEQIEGLIGTYLDVPSVVATLLTDEGTISEVDQQVLALALQLEGVPEGKSIEVTDPGNPAVTNRLRDLGLQVEKVPGSKNIRITQTGADVVSGILAGLTGYRETTIGVRYAGSTGTMTRANGGLDVHRGNSIIQAFANGGFPTGMYSGGQPIYKFAEPETGWEAFISGRKGQERRNAHIAMSALERLGFPVVPVSALRGVPAFANGGMAGTSGATQQAVLEHPESRTEWNMTIVNPVVRDPFEQAWAETQEKGAL